MRTAVVTGTASGIGAAEVARLRACGARVVGGDRDERVNQLRSGDADYIYDFNPADSTFRCLLKPRMQRAIPDCRYPVCGRNFRCEDRGFPAEGLG